MYLVSEKCFVWQDDVCCVSARLGRILIASQNQAAFQKQDKFSYRKVHLLGKKANQRWYANIGLGIKTPATAINGKYVDKKCPFTSDVTIRGAILKGLVISTKMERTIIVRRDYLRYVKKYRRYESRACVDLQLRKETS